MGGMGGAQGEGQEFVLVVPKVVTRELVQEVPKQVPEEEIQDGVLAKVS